MKFNELGRSFFRKMVQIRSNFVTTCTIKGTRGAKLPVDATFSGRSMVEMLGVLAIIGVLSVGAISGYSKAMLKYKLNKQAEQLNTVINAVARNVHSFSNDFRNQYVTSYFIKMGEIPSEMVQTKDDTTIEDIFGNLWVIRYGYDAKNGLESMNLATSSMNLSKNSALSLEVCKNLLLIAKENSDSINYVSTLSNYQSDDELLSSIYGDNTCKQGRKCLKDMSLDNIYEICTTHDGTAEFKIAWRI